MSLMLIPVQGQGGRVAVEVAGSGPLVLCVPGMGELRSSFRHLVPGLVAAGYRVAAMDLRGHGDSDPAFDSYDGVATAADILAVIAALGEGPSHVIGNSMAAGAAVVAAADSPESVARLVLIGPFVRNHGSAALGWLLRLALLRPWGPAVWRRYHASLFPSGGPSDHAAHLAAVGASLTRPGRWRPFQLTARTSHDPAEAALPRVTAPVLVAMGDRDPDFRDPEAEARWIADAVGGSHVMIAGAGHYPMADRAEPTLAAILPFLDGAPTRG